MSVPQECAAGYIAVAIDTGVDLCERLAGLPR
jgi:hypothetical protein